MQTIISQISSRKDFFKGKGLLEIGCCWLSFGAIIALEHILKPDMKVLELGSGGSSLFFARRVKEVHSVETDPLWHKAVCKSLKDFKNAHVLLVDKRELNGLILREPNEFYDVILVDIGRTPDYTPDRLKMALNAIPKLKTGGYLILDNYEKYGNDLFPYKNFNVYTFDEFGYSGKGTRILEKI